MLLSTEARSRSKFSRTPADAGVIAKLEDNMAMEIVLAIIVKLRKVLFILFSLKFLVVKK
jgi:hypothetical protein